ncbi:MAG: hypothetical protein HC827_19370 [Cyanobacteria bacterium RM1_2_2]|nr:hypothetical protein [Cyanobacteria bacterium RM1_2_2]
MPESTERSSAHLSESEQLDPSENQENPSKQAPIDPRDLVYRGGYSGNPREIVENPAVAPEMLEPAPEDLRDDLMPKDED